MMKGILAIANMRNEIGVLKPLALKRVDEIFKHIFDQFDLEDFADEIAGEDFITFLMGTHLNQYIVTHATLDAYETDILLTGYNTNTRKIAQFWLSKKPIYNFSLSISDDALQFFENKDLYLSRKPKRGDYVVHLKDLNDPFFVTEIDVDFGQLKALNVKRPYHRNSSDICEWIVLNRDPIKLMYEITDKIPNESTVVKTYFDYKHEQMPLIEGAERTIRVIKVK